MRLLSFADLSEELRAAIVRDMLAKASYYAQWPAGGGREYWIAIARSFERGEHDQYPFLEWVQRNRIDGSGLPINPDTFGRVLAAHEITPDHYEWLLGENWCRNAASAVFQIAHWLGGWGNFSPSAIKELMRKIGSNDPAISIAPNFSRRYQSA